MPKWKRPRGKGTSMRLYTWADLRKFTQPMMLNSCKSTMIYSSVPRQYMLRRIPSGADSSRKRE